MAYLAMEPLLSTADSERAACKPLMSSLTGKGTIKDYTREIQGESTLSVYWKLEKHRERVQELEWIISAFQKCGDQIDEVGSSIIVSRLFTLKQKILASKGYSELFLQYFTDAVEEVVGPCASDVLSAFAEELCEFCISDFEGLKVCLWARAFTAPHSISDDIVAQAHAKKSEFLQHAITFFRQQRSKYCEGETNNLTLKWFVFGLQRHCNRGLVGFLDQDSYFKKLKNDGGLLGWTVLGWVVMNVHRKQLVEPDLFGTGHDEWRFLQVATVVVPQFILDLIDLRSAMEEHIIKVENMQTKFLALFVSVSITGCQLLAKFVMSKTTDDDHSVCTCSFHPHSV